jgi:hypothetical protein
MALILTYHPLMVHMGTTTLVGSLEALSGRNNNQTAEFVIDFEFASYYPPGRIPSLSFGLTLRLYHWTIVCNFFFSYLKMFYHVAYLTLHQSLAKKEKYGQPVAQVPSLRLNKVLVFAGGPKLEEGYTIVYRKDRPSSEAKKGRGWTLVRGDESILEAVSREKPGGRSYHSTYLVTTSGPTSPVVFSSHAFKHALPS